MGNDGDISHAEKEMIYSPLSSHVFLTPEWCLLSPSPFLVLLHLSNASVNRCGKVYFLEFRLLYQSIEADESS